MSITTEKVSKGIAVTRRDDGVGDPVVVTTTVTLSDMTLIEIRLSNGTNRIKKLSCYIPNGHARLFAEQILTNVTLFEEASKIFDEAIEEGHTVFYDGMCEQCSTGLVRAVQCRVQSPIRAVTMHDGD
jgi:hypothetical protein